MGNFSHCSMSMPHCFFRIAGIVANTLYNAPPDARLDHPTLTSRPPVIEPSGVSADYRLASAVNTGSSPPVFVHSLLSTGGMNASAQRQEYLWAIRLVFRVGIAACALAVLTCSVFVQAENPISPPATEDKPLPRAEPLEGCEQTSYQLKLEIEKTMNTAEPVKPSAEAAEVAGALLLSIVVADDEPGILHLLTRSLRLLQHRVVGSASNGQEAVEMTGIFQPDLVILDIDMPVMNGIEAARTILLTRNLPIIISTGRADEATLRRLQNLNIGAYLVKPFGLTQLKAAVFVAMSRHQGLFEQSEAAAH